MSKMIAENQPETQLMSKRCRTLDIAIPGYEECLREGPNPCRYALPFGYGFLCHHPSLRATRADDPRSGIGEGRRLGARPCN